MGLRGVSQIIAAAAVDLPTIIGTTGGLGASLTTLNLPGSPTVEIGDLALFLTGNFTSLANHVTVPVDMIEDEFFVGGASPSMGGAMHHKLINDVSQTITWGAANSRLNPQYFRNASAVHDHDKALGVTGSPIPGIPVSVFASNNVVVDFLCSENPNITFVAPANLPNQIHAQTSGASVLITRSNPVGDVTTFTPGNITFTGGATISWIRMHAVLRSA